MSASVSVSVLQVPPVSFGLDNSVRLLDAYKEVESKVDLVASNATDTGRYLAHTFVHTYILYIHTYIYTRLVHTHFSL